MTDTINLLERKVTQKFLQSEDIEVNDNELSGIKIIDRHYTGVGFLTDFKQPFEFKFDLTKLSPRGNITVKINKNIMTGYIFYTEGKKLIGVEGFTYGDDEWPKEVISIEILS